MDFQPAGRWAIAILLLALTSPARAEGPAKTTVAEDIKSARQQMKIERWKDAAKTLRGIFERHPGSPEVVRRLDDIESDLKVSLFRAQALEPHPSDLFGEAVQSLDMRSRKITLSYPRGPCAPHWDGTPGVSGFLKIPLDGDVSIEFTVDVRGEKENEFYAPHAVLCFDAEKGTGYRLYPGMFYEDYGDKSTYSDDPTILRLDPGGEEKKLEWRPAIRHRSVQFRCRAARKSSTVSISVGPEVRVSAKDVKYLRGIVGVVGQRVWEVEVKGTVEETHLRALVAAHLDKGFRAWLKESWNRETEIPSWARSVAPAATAVAKPLLPSDAPDPLPPGLADALERWRQGGAEAAVGLAESFPALPPRTSAYLEALGEIAFRRYGSAEAALDAILKSEPDCAAALLHRGIIRLHLRDLEGATADLALVKAAAASMPSLHLALTQLAIHEGDLDRAHGHIGDAKVSGAWSSTLELFAGWVQRSRQGPQWPRKFESRNRNTVVTTDHSVELCREVASLVERSWGLYTTEFTGTLKPRAPLRIWVFSNREGYLRYAAELGRNLEKTAGAFIPHVGEMVLFVPDLARADFRETVKHEAFHAFLDGVVEGAPTWFDEGFAQWFESVEVKDGRLIPDRKLASAAEILRDRLSSGSLTPLKKLLCMDHAEFMKKSDIHYPESWALVQFLQESQSPPGRTLLFDYLRSLRKGMARDEVFAKHFEPLLPALEAKFFDWLSGRLREPEGR